jgi:HEAT repeat protein
VSSLIRALNDEDAEVRAAAAEALGKLGDVRAVDPLEEALNDESAAVKLRATWALEKLGVPPSSQ